MDAMGLYSVYRPTYNAIKKVGFGWDSLLEMVHSPGGDWHPAWGVVPSYINKR